MSSVRIRIRSWCVSWRTRVAFSTGIALAVATGATAQEKPAYEQMSLEELLSVDISTATKTDVSLDETPVMVEVIQAQQIKERGYRHLGDVLNDIVTNHVDRANWAVGQPLSQNSGFGFRFDTGQNILVLFN